MDGRKKGEGEGDLRVAETHPFPREFKSWMWSQKKRRHEEGEEGGEMKEVEVEANGTKEGREGRRGREEEGRGRKGRSEEGDE